MLTVAVTGPTGEIGRPFISALERMPEVERVIGMARRPFDIAGQGWEKTEYRRGDVLDREAVEVLVADADVVVHLAFVIVAGGGDSREVNLSGSRNVFEAAAAAGAKRLVYTSSVAAYGFDRGLPALLDEEEPVRGTSRHPYSAHKAAVEAELEEALRDSGTEAYVFRPCIVAGPQATLLLDRSRCWRSASASPVRCAGRWARFPSCARCCPTRESPSSWSTTTTSRRRSPPPSSATASPASTTSRAPAS